MSLSPRGCAPSTRNGGSEGRLRAAAFEALGAVSSSEPHRSAVLFLHRYHPIMGTTERRPGQDGACAPPVPAATPTSRRTSGSRRGRPAVTLGSPPLDTPLSLGRVPPGHLDSSEMPRGCQWAAGMDSKWRLHERCALGAAWPGRSRAGGLEGSRGHFPVPLGGDNKGQAQLWGRELASQEG